MNDSHPENIIQFAQRRRLRRTLEFLAATMRTVLVDNGPARAHPFDDLKDVAGLPIDVAAVRDIRPKLRREFLAHVRRRQRTGILARLRDPVEGIAELMIDVALYDTGVAILHDLSIYTDGRGWWLLGRPRDVPVSFDPRFQP